MVLGLQNIAKKSLQMIPKVVFVLGGPGAGKGTQCQKIFQVNIPKNALACEIIIPNH